jgi:hypothetical protein
MVRADTNIMRLPRSRRDSENDSDGGLNASAPPSPGVLPPLPVAVAAVLGGAELAGGHERLGAFG